MTLGCVVVELPYELVRKSSVVVLVDLGVELLHPPDFDEEVGEVLVDLVEEYPLLDGVAEPVVAVLSPQVVNGFEVGFGDELDLGEEDVASLLGSLAGEDDEEAASLFVGFAEVLGGEVLL